jgi:hypothetical protein
MWCLFVCLCVCGYIGFYVSVSNSSSTVKLVHILYTCVNLEQSRVL